MRWQLAVEATDLANTSIDPWHLIGAGLALLAGWVGARFARRAAARVVGRLDGISPEFAGFVVKLAGYIVLFIGFGVALAFLGAQIQPLLVVAIVGAVVVALALRGISDNFAAGILLQTLHPIGVGDEIESSEHVGVVGELGSRAVTIDTADGRQVYLPNSEVIANPLVNNSARGSRRSEVQVRVTSVDAADAQRRAVATAGEVPGVLTDPPPMGFVTAIDPERVTLRIWFWHLPFEGVAVTSEVVKALAAAAPGGGPVTVIAPPPLAPLTPPASV